MKPVQTPTVTQVNMSDIEEILTVQEEQSNQSQTQDGEPTNERDPLSDYSEEDGEQPVKLIEMKGLANTQQMWSEMIERIETTADVEKTPEKKNKKRKYP